MIGLDATMIELLPETHPVLPREAAPMQPSGPKDKSRAATPLYPEMTLETAEEDRQFVLSSSKVVHGAASAEQTWCDFAPSSLNETWLCRSDEDLNFDELLGRLASAHHRVVAENARLGSECQRLSGKTLQPLPPTLCVARDDNGQAFRNSEHTPCHVRDDNGQALRSSEHTLCLVCEDTSVRNSIVPVLQMDEDEPDDPGTPPASTKPRVSRQSEREEKSLKNKGTVRFTERSEIPTFGAAKQGSRRFTERDNRRPSVRTVPVLPRLSPSKHSDEGRLKLLTGDSSVARAVGHVASKAAFMHEKPTRWSAVRKRARDIVYSTYFEAAFGLCIGVDCVILGIDAQDGLHPFVSDRTVVDVISTCIKSAFIVELLMRFIAFGVAKSLQNSSWIRFDAVLAVVSLADMIFFRYLESETQGTSNMVILRMFRVARLARAVRLLTEFRTLWLLISGLRASVGTIMWTFMLIVVMSYIYAVLGMMTIPPPDDEADVSEYSTVANETFGHLGDAMLTLLQVFTLDSIGSIYRPLIMSNPSFVKCIWCASYFMSYILIASIALMNLVTAVMVEASFKQASEDREALRHLEEQKKRKMMPQLRDLFEILDEDESGSVSWSEIENAPQEIKEQLAAIAHSDNLPLIFALLDDDDSGYVQIDEFLEGLLNASLGDCDVLLYMGIARLVRQLSRVKSMLSPPP